MLEKAETWAWRVLLLAFTALLISTSNPSQFTDRERARAFTRTDEFDFARWTLDAVWVKLRQAALNSPHYFDREARKEMTLEYFRLTDQMIQVEDQVARVFSDPGVADPVTASASLRDQWDRLSRRRAQIQPLVEAVLEQQVAEVAVELGLTVAGQPVPPVLAHITPLPYNLVVSPRDRIQQDFSISLNPNLTVDQHAAIETKVDSTLDVSSLVVPVGGIGSYPTMVMRTGWMPWAIETFAHEWMHNYLEWHPLGIRYGDTPELRTMNETTASIFGNEVSRMIVERFYPELAERPRPPVQTVGLPAVKPDPDDIPRPVFDFRAEMHTTRLRVDELLAEGKIEEAEAYMEARRIIFWNHGYTLRKLNQAYFAFHGAYADSPGGAAGEDPVGPAVRVLREKSTDLGDFIRRMAWMKSFEDLQEEIQSFP
ncbi:MAG: hypothetical protein AB1846_11960 [Chloroflexota bacterium]